MSGTGMKKRFPRAKVEVTYHVEAFHSLPESSHPQSSEVHGHTWWITIGYHHERNGPFTWDRQELHGRYMPIIEKMRGQNLTEVCGESASDEVIASWVVKQLPGWVDFVTVDRLTPDEDCVKAITTVRRIDLE